MKVIMVHILMTTLLINQVKRLYETFHEPFKRVVPSRLAVPVAPAPNDLNPGSFGNETPATETESVDTSKRQKKDSEATVKSALSVAFAKYSDKIGKKNSQADKESGEGCSNRKQNSEAD